MKPSGLGRKAGIICFWLVLWQLISIAVHNSIVLVGPAEVAGALVSQISTVEFWRTIGLTFGKICSGFSGAFLAGILVGSAACRFPFLKDLLEPVMVLVKSVPVASFVILALIWIGSKNLSVFIAFLVVFPMIYVNTISGLNSADAQLLEMAGVFHMSGWKKFRYIYWPALLPYLINGAAISLGMSFKSGIAAEVIGVPDHSIGEKLYMAKIYLSTADLFAWTLVIIVISGLFEKAFIQLLKAAKRQNRANGKRGA
ncbi:ABC transporter permease subunit [Hungatella sp.]|uniref:ABC transporter permease n=1 Tax=Hungatella sp. TaxID=2613924 RepID=UPI0025885ADA|nr:ABC transporter permease subunit [Hungatella sp.]MCI6453358.1 ABC transporter permease subunit [Hungatella sp.]